MKDNTLKTNPSKKLAKTLSSYLKSTSDIVVIILATIITLLAAIWVLSFAGLGLIYYFFKTDQPLYAWLIIILDLFLIRSYIKMKP